MANNSDWSTGLPSGGSNIALGDNDIRSNNSALKAGWEDEHYWLDGSANSAGVHKAGSARAFSQSAAPNASLPKGQLWHDPDDDALYVAEAAGTGSWTQVNSQGATVGSVNTYTALQVFTKDLNVGSNTTMSLRSTGHIFMTVAAGTGSTSSDSQGNIFMRRGGSNYELVIRWGDGTTDVIATGPTL